MDSRVPCRLLLTLLDLPNGKQGRYGQTGISTTVIQWILVYTVDFQIADIVGQDDVPEVGTGRKRGRLVSNESFRQVSKYLGVSQCYHAQVRKSLMRFQDEIYQAMGWKGGEKDEI